MNVTSYVPGAKLVISNGSVTEPEVPDEGPVQSTVPVAPPPETVMIPSSVSQPVNGVCAVLIKGKANTSTSSASNAVHPLPPV